MNKPVEIPEAGTIMCDNPKCDYTLDNVKFEDLHNHINSLCPKCAEVLVTNDDYVHVMALHETARLINTLSPEELEMLKAIVPEQDLMKFMHGQATNKDERLAVLFNSRTGKFDSVSDAEILPDTPETEV